MLPLAFVLVVFASDAGCWRCRTRRLWPASSGAAWLSEMRWLSLLRDSTSTRREKGFFCRRVWAEYVCACQVWAAERSGHVNARQIKSGEIVGSVESPRSRKLIWCMTLTEKGA
eukprot:706519-Rhodomonas_salina.2